MPRERAVIFLGRLLGARVLPRNLVLRRQGINQGMPADRGLLTLTGQFVVSIPEKLYRKGLSN